MTETKSPPLEPAALDEPVSAKNQRREKSREEKRSHTGVVVRFRVFPQKAARVKERVVEASMAVSEFCRRAAGISA